MAVDSLVKRFIDERDQKVALIETLASTAEEEGRDLYTTDLETIDNARSRIRELDSQIDKVSGDLEMADSVRSRVRALDPNIVSRDFTYRSAGEYLWDAIHRNENQDAATRFTKYHKRAAEHLGLDKANTIAVAGGFNGLVVASPQGAVLDPSPAGRPLLTALGVTPVTSSTFTRPRIVDPNFDTGVAEQAQEKSELTSKTWDILGEPITLSPVGGYINVSELLIEMISSSLDMVISHMNRRLEWYSERAAVTEIGKTTEVIAAADATAAGIQAAIGAASAAVFTNTRALPTWLAMGPAGYGLLLGLTDLAGRPMFPAVGPSNAMGGGDPNNGVAGLRPVVTGAINDDSLYMGNSAGIEVYEKRMPVLSAIEPAVFGRQIAVVTALAFYSPITQEGATPERNGVVKITIP